MAHPFAPADPRSEQPHPSPASWRHERPAPLGKVSYHVCASDMASGLKACEGDTRREAGDVENYYAWRPGPHIKDPLGTRLSDRQASSDRRGDLDGVGQGQQCHGSGGVERKRCHLSRLPFTLTDEGFEGGARRAASSWDPPQRTSRRSSSGSTRVHAARGASWSPPGECCCCCEAAENGARRAPMPEWGRTARARGAGRRSPPIGDHDRRRPPTSANEDLYARWESREMERGRHRLWATANGWHG